MNKAIFIDKDGTLIKDVPYNVDPLQVRFEKYAFESLYSLQQQGYELIIISNQPGIAMGYFKAGELATIEKKIKDSLFENKVKLNGFYYCPHAENDQCNCRKPKPGLILKAANDLHIDLFHSWMIGDILNDVEAGNRSNCKTILIDNGNETEWKWKKQRIPHYTANDLKAAAYFILHHAS